MVIKPASGEKVKPARSRVRKSPAAKAQVRSVVVQARVEPEFFRELIEVDAPALGLDGASALVREGLRLVHRKAQEQAMVDAHDQFYRGRAAPLPDGVAEPDRD